MSTVSLPLAATVDVAAAVVVTAVTAAGDAEGVKLMRERIARPRPRRRRRVVSEEDSEADAAAPPLEWMAVTDGMVERLRRSLRALVISTESMSMPRIESHSKRSAV